jgi:predicted RNA methylase
MRRVGARALIRRLVEPPAGSTRRLPAGPARGVTLAAEPAATASADMWVGLFESEIAPYVRRFCRPGTISVDVGAHSGYYALTFAERCRAPVIAYEPDAAALERLARNLDLNSSIASWVDIRAVAVADVDGPGSVTLDADLATVGRIGLLKVDVDRAELAVLEGARRLLAGAHPDVILETHSAELEDACARLLIEAGYAPRVITPRRILPQHRPTEHNRWLVAAGV